MIEGPTDFGGLSDEEIKELLRDDAPAEDPSRGEEPGLDRRVLVVSRRDAEAGLFRSRLEARGVQVSVARNPFTALDQLRRAAFDGLISDLDLWAQEGALLLDRLKALRWSPPVLFLADRSRDPGGRLEERLRSAGVWRVLFRPVQTGAVEASVDALLAASRSRAHDACPEAPHGLVAPGGSLRPEARPVDHPEPQHLRRAGAGDSEDVTLGDAARHGAVGSSEAASGDSAQGGREDSRGELAWLRFFRHGVQALCSGEDLDSAMWRLLRLALEDLQPRAAAVFYRRAGLASASLAAAALHEPSEVWLEVLEASRSPSRSRDSLSVALGAGENAVRLVLVGLPPAVASSSSPYLEDLRLLAARGA